MSKSNDKINKIQDGLIDAYQVTLETKERLDLFNANRGKGVEKAYKENRINWKKYPEDLYVSEYPLHVDLELAAICNLNCPMCYTVTPEFKKEVKAKLMDYTLYKKLIDECADGGVYSVRLSLRGEPFLHKNFVECIRYAKSKGIKEVSTLTNGTFLDEEMFSNIMEAGIDWITISFDGLGKTYETIRYPTKFNRALEKIQNYAKIKKAAGKVKPLINIQSILPAIEDNPEEFYKTFAPISDKITANPLIDFHSSKSVLGKIENFTCPQIYQRLVIGADGLCMMCSNDESGKYIVGNVNEQSIHEIWHGKNMQRIRNIHEKHNGCKSLSPCQECHLPLKTKTHKINVGDSEHIVYSFTETTDKVYEIKSKKSVKRPELTV
jgi:radical SAM protein with 4Fe4S-binding SPASM domain